jgi:hypothetical protein
MNYYYLIAGLPDIVADEKKLSFTSVEFKEMLSQDLNKEDFELAKLYYLPYDHKNLLNTLFKKTDASVPWDPRGCYPKEIIEIAGNQKSFELADDITLHPYLTQFLNKFYSEEGFDNYFAAELSLTSAYYNYLSECSNNFVKEVAEHDKLIGNVMAALSGKKHELQYENNLIGEDDITNAIRKSRARDFGLSGDAPEVETLTQIYETENLVDREYKLDLYKWQYLDEKTFFNYFTIEKILAYIQKLFISERWYGLDKDKGRQMFNKILEELNAGFKLPDEYTIAYGKKK